MPIVFLLAGLVFLAVGASIIVLETQALRSGVATRGRIVGYSERRGDSGPMYHTVIEFVDLEGRKRLSESAVGSGFPLGRVGDATRVVLRPWDPDRATIESRVIFFMGIVIALLGAVSCGAFVATFRSDLFSIVTSVVVIALAGVKLHSLYARRGEVALSWRRFVSEALSSRTIDARAREEIAWADPAGLAATIGRQRTANRFAAPLLVIMGVGLLFLALHLHRTTNEFLARAIPGSGRVVDLAANDSTDGTTYAAMVEFEAGGERHTFKDSLAANPPVYRAGEVVAIRYLPDDPGVARIDRGIWNRLWPGLIGALGVLLSAGGLWLCRPLTDSRRQPYAPTRSPDTRP
jgi:uncharacterized protein DUF3592